MGGKLDTNPDGKMAADGELVTLTLADLQPFSKHPYKVRDDEAMRDMVESIKQYGVLSPAIARPMPDGGYELVSGHRRKRACELAGLETIPVIVRDLDDDAAAILVVDSNLQREDLLPSERAFAYKLKMEALRHQGERSDLTSRQVGDKLNPSALPDAAVPPASAYTQTPARSAAGPRAASYCPRRGSPPRRRPAHAR